MVDKIKEELDKYLEFDSNELFEYTDYFVIFGGAIRDIIAGDSDKINDIDIMSLPISRKNAISVVEKYGYIKLELFPPDLFLLYNDIKCIFEPKTYVKGNKKIQFITPKPDVIVKNEMLYNNFFNILCNIDLSSSGVFYDGENIYESFYDSITHCKNKVYVVNENAKMYNSKRITFRENNLYSKGWKEIKISDDVRTQRFNKIARIRNINEQLTINNFKYKLNNSDKFGRIKKYYRQQNLQISGL